MQFFVSRWNSNYDKVRVNVVIEYIEGKIFDSPAQVIVNTVNTVGVMGKGLALEYKRRYPKMFERYRTVCERHQFTIGQLMLFYEPDHWVLLFPTKENWRYPSKLEYLEKGLMKFVNSYAEKNITSIAFPRLGCGNGELLWDDVKPLMEKYLSPLPIDVYIYLGVYPDEQPEHKIPQKTMDWLKANAKDMSFNGVKDEISLLCALLPFEFRNGEKLLSVTYNEGLLFTDNSNDEKYFVNEDCFYEIWDDIRQSNIFPVVPEDRKLSSVYSLLNELGYLSKIKLFDSRKKQMVDGYQMNAGYGRMFSFKG